jgi:hypothetical protein
MSALRIHTLYFFMVARRLIISYLKRTPSRSMFLSILKRVAAHDYNLYIHVLRLHCSQSFRIQRFSDSLSYAIAVVDNSPERQTLYASTPASASCKPLWTIQKLEKMGI